MCARDRTTKAIRGIIISERVRMNNNNRSETNCANDARRMNGCAREIEREVQRATTTTRNTYLRTSENDEQLAEEEELRERAANEQRTSDTSSRMNVRVADEIIERE